MTLTTPPPRAADREVVGINWKTWRVQRSGPSCLTPPSPRLLSHPKPRGATRDVAPSSADADTRRVAMPTGTGPCSLTRSEVPHDRRPGGEALCCGRLRVQSILLVSRRSHVLIPTLPGVLIAGFHGYRATLPPPLVTTCSWSASSLNHLSTVHVYI